MSTQHTPLTPAELAATRQVLEGLPKPGARGERQAMHDIGWRYRNDVGRLIATIDRITGDSFGDLDDIARLRRENESSAEQLAEALALLAETRRALDLCEEYVPQYDGCVAWEALKALDALTPPQALREREERVGALEKVYQALDARWSLRWHEATTEQDHVELAALSAVAIIDQATKGGQP